MSQAKQVFSIKVLIFQTNPSQNEFFHVVEKTVWNSADGGTWSEVDGCDTLRMGDSGTSGALRLLSNKGEGCIITLGVHKDKRWGDIITNLKNDQTACVINPQYYSKDHPNMEKQRERQLTSYDTTDLQGRKFSFEYTVSEGHDLTVRVIIA
ncbi:fungal fruit body lectin [Lactarius hengduanensis]|nr:fungal fruit body lectin [Lactarius hengduanensis]